MKKKVIVAFMAGVLTTIMVIVCANWFEHRHDNDVHVTIVSKEAVTWTNETTGAVISTGLEIVLETDGGSKISGIAENTLENHDSYQIGDDFWIPEDHIGPEKFWNYC